MADNPMRAALDAIAQQLHDDDPAEFHGTEANRCRFCTEPNTAAPVEEPTVGPRCGNNPNVRLTPGDRKIVDEFRDFLTRRQGGGPQTVLRCNQPDGEHQPHDWEPVPSKTVRCFGDYERPRP